MATTGKKWGKLPETTEVELLKVLLHPRLKLLPFVEVCDSNPEVFGEKASDLRRRCSNRRDYLRNNREAFDRAVKRFPDLQSFASPVADSLPHSARFDSPSPSRLCFSPFFGKPSPYQPAIMSDETVESVSSYTINLSQPWKNPENIFVLMGERSYLDGVNAATRVNLYVPIYDVVDFFQERYKAWIAADDYGTICLLKPAIPGAFIRKAATIQDNELQQQHQEPKIVEQHKIVAAACGRKGNEHLLKRLLKLKLPDGMTASNAAYNDNKVSGTNNLSFRIRRVGIRYSVEVPDTSDRTQKKKKEVEQTHYFGVVSFMIDGTQVPIEDDNTTSNEADQLADLFDGTVTFVE
jgi:hypothetical protein